MVRRPACGLTLVEVLVLIGIIGLVLALLIPSVTSPNGGRRFTCMNNQKQIGLAMQIYEGQFRKFPGWKNNLTRVAASGTESTLAVSWVVPILPNLERIDLYRNWQDADVATTDLAVFLRLLICPSDPPESTLATSTPLSYVVNCGNGTQNPACGVFFDASDSAATEASMSLDYLSQHDGSATTLMLSENINVGGEHRWDAKDADVTIDRVGFRWDRGRINEAIDEDRPRPSSHHPGGVIATFCDGHVVFLSEDISESVFQHLSTPDSAAAGVPGELKEGDY